MHNIPLVLDKIKSYTFMVLKDIRDFIDEKKENFKNVFLKN